ncbi:retrovirus-related Pol polyprotein from transposon 17.6 [Trichonephila clavipes]|nr:retrovirus-related Pol polyprotein from transposon 17.6 [Trichonephila clavipes]
MEKAAECLFNCCSETKGLWRLLQQERSSVKNFSIGEQVVLLIPDSSNKIYARWTGPGEIIQHHPPHSYKVKLSDGTSEREQVLAIVLKHQTLFTSDVKIAKVGTHRIRLKPNIERKKPFVYRIPESLKIKVDEQIEELLRLDLIEESDAEIAYQLFALTRKMVPYDFALTSEL